MFVFEWNKRHGMSIYIHSESEALILDVKLGTRAPSNSPIQREFSLIGLMYQVKSSL
jgi:rRNA pseudouridine-1189 N-methylase Emg1 (Nep1/Mra1 family)